MKYLEDYNHDDAVAIIVEDINDRHGYIIEEEAQRLLSGFGDSPSLHSAPVAVKCGGERFSCRLSDLAKMIRCVEEGGDYVRSVWVLPHATWKEIGINFDTN